MPFKEETSKTKHPKLYTLAGCTNCERTCKIQAVKGAKLFGCRDYKAIQQVVGKGKSRAQL